MSAPVGLDDRGHFPGCYTHSCAATRCSDARWMIEMERERLARAVLPDHGDHLSHAARTLDWEQRAIADAAAALLNAGAREVALELLTYTRRR